MVQRNDESNFLWNGEFVEPLVKAQVRRGDSAYDITPEIQNALISTKFLLSKEWVMMV